MSFKMFPSKSKIDQDDFCKFSKFSISVDFSDIYVRYDCFPKSAFTKTSVLKIYLTIRLRARVFYEQIVNKAQPSWLSLVENEGE